MFLSKIAIILIIFSLFNKIHCYDCGYTTNFVQLDNAGETGIVSQPSYCYQGLTVVAQNIDQSKNIKIRFTIVPSNFDIRIYNGQQTIDNNRIQNCQIQNGSICYSSENTVAFYFVPINAFGGYSNRVELTAIPWDNSPDNNNGLIGSISFLTLFFCVSSFVYATFF